jgi:hypothetical protein
MEQKNVNMITLSGEVVETNSHGHHFFIKVWCKPCYMLLELECTNKLHLGDKLIIQGNFILNQINTEYSEN